jgi:type I restriction enzyme S subunit
MEVRQGYKESEIGVIPTDWDVKPLGDCASFRTGPFGSALHKSDYVVGPAKRWEPAWMLAFRGEPQW